MKTYDPFILHIFTFSKKSDATKKTYMRWLSTLCNFAGECHPLDITSQDIYRFRVYLASEKQYSPASSALVRASLSYVYQTLLVEEVPEHLRVTTDYSRAFSARPKQQYRLPEFLPYSDIEHLLDVLPYTTAGNAIRHVAYSLQSLQRVLSLKTIDIDNTFPEYLQRQVHFCKSIDSQVLFPTTTAYVQQVVNTARKQAGLAPGVGVRVVRASSIIHRIQARTNDIELKEIFDMTGLSYQQFRLYRKAAGYYSTV